MREYPVYHGKIYGSGWLVALLAVSASFGEVDHAQCALDAASGAAPIGRSAEAARTGSGHFGCGYRPAQYWLDAVHAAVARGEIADPATRAILPIPLGRTRRRSATLRCLSPAHIFPFEDSNKVLLSDFSAGQLIDLMVSAANDLMAVHGDIYDFVGFWLNFAPHHEIGTAAYISIENDVTGIGVPGGVEPALFNLRAEIGVDGQNIEGMLITWNINLPKWQPGNGPEAFLTRVALGHELEHRFAMFLPDLLDGRRMQGYGGFGCYAPNHPNPAVDSQGSFLGIGEWADSNPAVIQASYPDFFLFNGDTGGSYSFTELYLMGYVSPVEMDAGNSELRYMDDWDCVAGDYSGPISTISSAEIIAAAGPRVPDSTAEDKHYRTGWIIIHLPGDPPNAGQRAKAVAIHEQLQIDWNFSTLGRGTMDNSLFDDCNCNDVPDDLEPNADCNTNEFQDICDIAEGTSVDCDGNRVPDECENTIEASGSRYITIRPPEGNSPVALLIRGDADDPDVACVSSYVQSDGTLGPVAVFRTPNEWCKVHAHDEAIIPERRYDVYVDDGFTISEPFPVITPLFGDTASVFQNGSWGAPDGRVDIITDAVACLDRFRNLPGAPPLPSCDLEPHAPDGVINITDIVRIINAFRGQPYPFARPCE